MRTKTKKTTFQNSVVRICIASGVVLVACAFQCAMAQERFVINIPGAVTSHRIALSASGRLVAATARLPKIGNSVVVWETKSEKPLTSVGGPSSYAKMFFSPDENDLTACYGSPMRATAPGTIVLRRDFRTGQDHTFRLAEGGGNMAISPSGRLLVTVQNQPNPTGIVWDLGQKGEVTSVRVDSKNLKSAAIDKSEKLVATGGIGGEIVVHELPSGKLVNKFKGESPRPENFFTTVHFIEFSPDGKLVAAIDGNEVARLWNVADGKLLATIPKMRTEECRFTPDGKYFVTMNSSVMEFRSLKDGTVVRKVGDDATKRLFLQFMFSDDGRTAALLAAGGTIHIWTIPEAK